MKIYSDYGLLEEIQILFSEMGAVASVLLAAGLLLCIIEISRPALGIFFGTGIVLIIYGFVVRLTSGGSLQMLFIMFFIVAFILTFAYIFNIRFNKYKWILYGASIEASTAIEDEDTESKDYYFLLNHEGVTVSELSPLGIIVINDIEFEAVSHSGEILPDTPVRVVEIENEKIVVKPV